MSGRKYGQTSGWPLQTTAQENRYSEEAVPSGSSAKLQHAM